MIYISLGSILLIILSISNFLNIKFKIKINETYFVSCSIIILLSYWSYLLSIYYNKDYLIYSYYLLNIFAFIVALYLIKNYSKIDQKFNIEGDHVNCVEPEFGAKVVTGNQTVSPEGVTWKMKKDTG